MGYLGLKGGGGIGGGGAVAACVVYGAPGDVVWDGWGGEEGRGGWEHGRGREAGEDVGVGCSKVVGV